MTNAFDTHVVYIKQTYLVIYKYNKIKISDAGGLNAECIYVSLILPRICRKGGG